MVKKEQTNGGSKKLVVNIGRFIKNKNNEMEMTKKETGKLTIATVAKLKELEENGFLEIKAEPYDVFKEGEKVVKRVAKDGKELKSTKQGHNSKDTIGSR